MQVSIIGAGYVGLTTAACLAGIGHTVLCADSDSRKLALLENGELPFFEPHLSELVTRARAARRLIFTTTEDAIVKSEIVFICVGTPPLSNGEADLSSIADVARQIAQRSRGYRLVVEKSTVPVQTARQLGRHLALYKTKELEYDIVSNPEFLREGSAVQDFFHPDRIVVGSESQRAIGLMRDLYRPVLEQQFDCPIHRQCPPRREIPFVVTDSNSAELIKHGSNSFLAMKISFINLVADLCEAAGADVQQVARGIGLDPRIGPAFLCPGIGFGGFCFPKDLQAFVRIAESFGCDFSLLKEVERINHRRIEQFLAKLKAEMWALRGKRIAVWGLAFKPNTDDVRFAPALDIIRRLVAEGVEVRAYDPQAMEKAKIEIPDITYCNDVYETAQGVDAVLLLTEWDEFRSIDWQRVRSVVDRPLLLDGRNMFGVEEITAQGFEYVAVGRPRTVIAGSPEMLAATGNMMAVNE